MRMPMSDDENSSHVCRLHCRNLLVRFALFRKRAEVHYPPYPEDRLPNAGATIPTFMYEPYGSAMPAY